MTKKNKQQTKTKQTKQTKQVQHNYTSKEKPPAIRIVVHILCVFILFRSLFFILQLWKVPQVTKRHQIKYMFVALFCIPIQFACKISSF